MRRFVLALFLWMAAAEARADSWPAPTPHTTPSANQAFRVVVTPRTFGLPEDDARARAMARVEQVAPDGRWRRLREFPLVNRVGPVTSLLSNDGRHLVTFDNWGSHGIGDDVMVIYDAHGRPVRRFALDELLPPVFLRHLPRTVSSLRWSCRHRLVESDRIVELQVKFPGSGTQEESRCVPVRIRLADGAVLPRENAAWHEAMAKAHALEAERHAAWDALRRTRARPLAPPRSDDARAWRVYLFELRDRLVEPGGSMMPWLHTDDSKRGQRNDGVAIHRWVVTYDPGDRFRTCRAVVASPLSDRLAHLLVGAFRTRRPGTMDDVELYFVGTPEEGARVAVAARHTGARVILVDRTAFQPPGPPLPESPHETWMPRTVN